MLVYAVSYGVCWEPTLTREARRAPGFEPEVMCFQAQHSTIWLSHDKL